MPKEKEEKVEEKKEVKAEPAKVADPIATEHEKECADVLAKMQQILEKHDNMESNVPFNSDYWLYRNQYNALRMK